MPKQRLVISNLHEVGLVDNIDAINLKENALVDVRNVKPRKGRLACATKLGASISATPAITSGTYKQILGWKTYGSSNKAIALAGSNFMEWCDQDGNRSAVPYWMGIFGTSTTGGVVSGAQLGATYTGLGDAFASNVGARMSTSDRVWISEFAAGGATVDESLIKANNGLPAGWTTEVGSIKITGNAAVATTLSWAVNATTITNPNNFFLTIRSATLSELSASQGSVGIFFRDTTSKRGYLVNVSYVYAETDYGGPDEHMMRFYGGYLSDAANIYANSVLLANDVVELSATVDWTNYDDLWMWYRKPFITWGYGKQVMGTMLAEIPFGTVEVGFALKDGSIGPKPGGATHNPIMAWTLTDRGPYTPSAVSYAANTVTLTGLTTAYSGVVWGAKYADADTQQIRPSNEYVLRLSKDSPLLLWKGGMMPEYCPNAGQPTAEGYASTVMWTGNDACVFNAHVILLGSKILMSILNPGTGHYQFFPVEGYPTRMMYAKANDPDDWSSSDEGAGYQELIDTPGEIMAAKVLRDVLMIYKRDAVIQVAPTGLAENPFSFRYFDDQIGIDSPKNMISAGKFHFLARDENMYMVSTGDLSIVPTAATWYNYNYGYAWNHDNTVIFGQYNVTDDAFRGRCYDYKAGAMYELYLPDIVGLDDSGNYCWAITHAGAVYGCSGATIENSTAFDPYSTVQYWEPATQTMGTMEYNKMVSTVDVILRSTYAGYSPSVKLLVTVDNATPIAEQTVTAETIGSNLFRARFTNKWSGLYFKFKVTSNDAANRIGYVDFIRLEVEYIVEGRDKRATAT